ncbi:condensation domain-containing protein [Chitinophaga qingshengii]|uniref:Carrier domain-containing protein n=1 Tax=Chitinophaga qingshengii TaxID=1569794 RepID=A0ABR7TJP2_9BACT|nr:condensation domain-containing protein [Chitinophaga qingshengii]MBC9929274.1 hypothetical protein [Chitinophaga qingshengii]
MTQQYLHKANIQDISPLTPLQKGIYYHYLKGGDDLYCCQMSYRVNGLLDLQRLQTAFATLFRCHDVLRSVFLNKAGKIMSVILKEVQPDFRYRDVSGVSDPEVEIAAIRKEGEVLTFELERELPMRLTVVRLNETCHELIWSHHHIVMDGWCLNILIKDFYEAYRQLSLKDTVEMPRRPQFSSYLEWLDSRDMRTAAAYWEEYMSGYGAVTSLNNISRQQELRQMADFQLALDDALTKRLLGIAAERRVTLNTVVQTAWAVLLARYNACNDVCFGIVSSGRPESIQQVEDIVGLFINTLPVRIRYAHDTRLGDLLPLVQQQSLETEVYQYYPLVDIQAQTRLKNRLFDHLLVFENYPVMEGTNDTQEFRISDVVVKEQNSYDMSILAHCRDTTLSFIFRYNTSTYDTAFMSRLAGRLERVLRILSEHPDTLADEISIVQEEEKAIGNVFWLEETVPLENILTARYGFTGQTSGALIPSGNWNICITDEAGRVQGIDMLGWFSISGGGQLIRSDVKAFMNEKGILFFPQEEQTVIMPKEAIKTANDETAQQLAAAWSEILGIPVGEIDVDTHFFSYGGHSIKAIQVLSLINKAFNTRISLDQFFAKPTISQLADDIKAVKWVSYIEDNNSGSTKVRI